MKDFFEKKNVIAVVGASLDRGKWGWKIYAKLKRVFSKVYPVNPKYGKIDGDACYPDIVSLPEKPDVVITVVPPKVTEDVVKQCKDVGVSLIWMQPGSESKKSIKFCKDNNIKVVYNACFVVNGLKERFE